jgi:hypothetical protein
MSSFLKKYKKMNTKTHLLFVHEQLHTSGGRGEGGGGGGGGGGGDKGDGGRTTDVNEQVGQHVC